MGLGVVLVWCLGMGFWSPPASCGLPAGVGETGGRLMTTRKANCQECGEWTETTKCPGCGCYVCCDCLIYRQFGKDICSGCNSVIRNLVPTGKLEKD